MDAIQLVYLTFSAIGETVTRAERKGVVIDNMPEVCFVQMEKNMYRPGLVCEIQIVWSRLQVESH